MAAIVLIAVIALASQTLADPINYKQQTLFAENPVGQCPDEDGEEPTFLPDATFCNIFYICSAGVPVRKECLPELCFNTTLNVCAFPKAKTQVNPQHEPTIATFSADGTCPPRDTNETIYLRDTQNCSIYYICSNGNAIQNVCPPDMSWNNVAHICDWDIDADCTSSNSTVVLTEEEIAQYVADGTCPPRDTNETIYLRDTEDCSIYYICSNGNAIKNTCPPDMSWNNVAHICDWDLDAHCTSTNTTKRSINSTPFAAVGTCPPRDTNTTVFLTDSENCTIYYICSNGRPIQAACTPGMAWNSKLNICDWELNVDCPNKIKPLSAVGTCPSTDPPNPVYLPDSDSCKLYYECSGGIPIQNECPDDLEFNPTLMVCDYYLDAGCKAGGNSTSSSTSTQLPSTSSTTQISTSTNSSVYVI